MPAFDPQRTIEYTNSHSLINMKALSDPKMSVLTLRRSKPDIFIDGNLAKSRQKMSCEAFAKSGTAFDRHYHMKLI
jgi:hypothetical protein